MKTFYEFNAVQKEPKLKRDKPY